MSLLSCFYLVVWFWSCIQIHIIYPFSFIISASLNHLIEARSLVIWKAVHFVNQEYANLGHSEPERTQCGKKMGTIVQTREYLVFRLWLNDAQMWCQVSC